MVSIHYLYSVLRVMMRPLDTIQKKAATKISANKIIYQLYTVTLICLNNYLNLIFNVVH